MDYIQFIAAHTKKPGQGVFRIGKKSGRKRRQKLNRETAIMQGIVTTRLDVSTVAVPGMGNKALITRPANETVNGRG